MMLEASFPMTEKNLDTAVGKLSKSEHSDNDTLNSKSPIENNESPCIRNLEHSDNDTLNSKSPIKNNESPCIRNLATHKGYTSKRKIQALRLDEITSDLQKGCNCGENCLSDSDVHMILRWRKKYHLCPQGYMQRHKLFDMFRETKFCDEFGMVKGHIVESKKICRMAFYQILLRVSKRTYYRIQQTVNSGIEYLVKERVTSNHGDRGMIALGFMTSLVQKMGDKSPESERILLPAGLSVKEIFNRFEVAYQHDESRIKEKRFYGIWKEHFKDVSHQQRHSNFATCNVCYVAKETLESKHPIEVHQATRAEWDEHLLRQQQERLSYYVRRNDAIENPNEKMSLIIDGMDQSKTNIPHFEGWQVPKACDKSRQLQTHITGVLLHGIGTYAMIDLQQWPHDANLTMNSLLYVLAQQTKLPKTLYIQLDNCGRENKNRYFMGLMVLLILKDYFKEIWLSFLMVGHTHEDIDARFSKISTKLRTQSAKTLPELEEVIQSCLSSGIDTVLIPKIFNIRDWMIPHLNHVHNHSHPHVYRFTQDRKNHVLIKYKDWSTDKEWKPSPHEDQIELFHQNQNGESILPSGVPEEVEPSIGRKQDLEKIEENIKNLKPFLNFKQHSWWESFFEDHLKVSGYQPQQEWYLKSLQNEVPATPNCLPTAGTTSSPLAIFMNKERSSKQVYTGKRKSTTALEKAQDEKYSKLKPGSGFLIMFKDDAGEVGIGEVTEMGHEKLKLKLYIGELNGKWEPANDCKGCVFHREIKKDWIVDGMIFQLSKKMYLPNKVKGVLKNHI